MKVLILGGTSEARDAARALVEGGHDVTSSLAGRVTNPRLPVGNVTIGGFGGATGLAAWLRDHGVQAVLDATHPYATTMTANAVAACDAARVPLVRYARPGWAEHPLAASWSWVDTYDEARRRAEDVAGVPFLTTGRQTLPHYRPAWETRACLVRVVEPVDDPPAAWHVIRDRGPHDVDAEVDLMARHGVTALLTKDSGGTYTSAKLTAAHRLGVDVVVVRRPRTPSAVLSVTTTPQAVGAVEKAGDGLTPGRAAPA